MNSALGQGTTTFLFSDIEGSTRLLQLLGPAYSSLLEDQRKIIRKCIAAFHGKEVDTAGDGFFVAFDSARNAVRAAVAAQRLLLQHSWPEGASVRIRMGIHTGEPVAATTGYVGLDVHRASRICSVAHGGQVLLSRTTANLVSAELEQGVTLRDLGDHRLKDLIAPERLYQVVSQDFNSEFPPLKSVTIKPNNLPPQLQELLGRENDIEQLKELLARPHVRLITLTGPGGTGKTRLSLAVGASVLDEFEDGVFFVSLAPILDPSFVPSTILQTLGVPQSKARSSLDTLKDHLRDRAMVLILDNFEQIIDAAGMVGELLDGCHGLKILVTTRFVLRLRSEHEYPVMPLRVPDLKNLPPAGSLSQYAAVNLFIRRATAVKPDFAVTNDNAAAIAEICHQLDGLPLAIELAAARIKLFSPQALLMRLGSKFDILKGGPRDQPERHQTLREAIAWSYDLLTNDEKAVFRRLSVFMNGCTFEAAEAVCRAGGKLAMDVLDGIAALVDKSLLRRVEYGAEQRFIMLETIREFGAECLTSCGESDTTRRAHAEFFLQLAEQAGPLLTGKDQARWLDILEEDHDNIRGAFRWLQEQSEGETALRLCGAFWRFWIMRGHLAEGKKRLTEALALPFAPSHARLRAVALHALSTITHEIGLYNTAFELTEEALSIYKELDDPQGIVVETNGLAWILMHLGRMQEARARGEEALALCRSRQNSAEEASALNNLGWVANMTGEPVVAAKYFFEAMAIRRGLADRRRYAYTLGGAGWAEGNAGEYEKAFALLEESTAILRELRDHQLLAFTLSLRGLMLMRCGDYFAALLLLEESISMMLGMGNKWGIAFELGVLGYVQARLGNLAEGEKHVSNGAAMFTEEGNSWGLAVVLHFASRVAFLGNDLPNAEKRVLESLAIRQQIGDKLGLAEGLEQMGRIGVTNGDYENAHHMFKAAARIRQENACPVPPADADEVQNYMLKSARQGTPSRQLSTGEVLSLLLGAERQRASHHSVALSGTGADAKKSR